MNFRAVEYSSPDPMVAIKLTGVPSEWHADTVIPLGGTRRRLGQLIDHRQIHRRSYDLHVNGGWIKVQPDDHLVIWLRSGGIKPASTDYRARLFGAALFYTIFKYTPVPLNHVILMSGQHSGLCMACIAEQADKDRLKYGNDT